MYDVREGLTDAVLVGASESAVSTVELPLRECRLAVKSDIQYGRRKIDCFRTAASRSRRTRAQRAASTSFLGRL